MPSPDAPRHNPVAYSRQKLRLYLEGAQAGSVVFAAIKAIALWEGTYAIKRGSLRNSKAKDAADEAVAISGLTQDLDQNDFKEAERAARKALIWPTYVSSINYPNNRYRSTFQREFDASRRLREDTYLIEEEILSSATG